MFMWTNMPNYPCNPFLSGALKGKWNTIALKLYALLIHSLNEFGVYLFIIRTK